MRSGRPTTTVPFARPRADPSKQPRFLLCVSGSCELSSMVDPGTGRTPATSWTFHETGGKDHASFEISHHLRPRISRDPGRAELRGVPDDHRQDGAEGQERSRGGEGRGHRLMADRQDKDRPLRRRAGQGRAGQRGDRRWHGPPPRQGRLGRGQDGGHFDRGRHRAWSCSPARRRASGPAPALPSWSARFRVFVRSRTS